MKKIVLLFICFCCFIYNNVYAEELNCQNYLSYNSKGSEVRKLQNQLNKSINCNLTVDGTFGKKTSACVKKFQTKYNLTVDGVVGPKTCSKLNSLSKTNTTNNNKKEITATAKGSYFVTADRLNIRASSNTNSKILGELKIGDKINPTMVIFNKSDLWYKIKYTKKDGYSYGYVSGKHITNNAIKIDISEQNLKFYKEGTLIMNVPVITGKKDVNNTPTGLFTLEKSKKLRTKYLINYKNDGTTTYDYYNYWMPFNKNYSFYSSNKYNEKTDFNKTTYLKNGSNGSINMKKNDAKKLYNETNKNIKVFIQS